MSTPSTNVAALRSIKTISDIPESTRFRLQAYSSPVKINFEQLKDVFIQGTLQKLNRDCAVFERYDDEKIFIFRYGAAVFFNFPVAEHEHYLRKLGISSTQSSLGLTESLSEDHFIINVEPGVPKVSFNSVSVPELELNRLHLIAHVLAQSSALELVEREVDSFLAQSEEMTSLFRTQGFLNSNRNRMIRFLGEGLRARHRIVNQLALLKDPEKTWEKEELYLLYKELFANFEIVERFEHCEHMLELSSQVTELLIELVNARRAEILEIVIIVLICIEVVKGFF